MRWGIWLGELFRELARYGKLRLGGGQFYDEGFEEVLGGGAGGGALPTGRPRPSVDPLWPRSGGVWRRMISCRQGKLLNSF